MYLAIRTDSPAAELYLYNGEERVAHELWQADRRLALKLLGRIEAFLADAGKTFTELDGLVVYKGPGSFTGLRIGITVMNTIAYAEDIPIVGSNGSDWLDDGVSYLQNEENHQIVLPEYGAEARITKPKK